MLLALASCGTDSPKSTQTPASSTVEVPVFNPDTAYHYVAKQVAFGPRVISSSSWAACSEYLTAELRRFTPHVQVQEAPVTTYDGKKHRLRNIIAEFNPEKSRRILLCAHWDTRPIADQDSLHPNAALDGANDGASGVGVLLEVARQMSLQTPNTGVDIVFFDAEDYGQPENDAHKPMQDSWCLGSQYWAQNLHRDNYYARFGILLDMVGAEDATFTWEGVSKNFASFVQKKVWKAAHKAGYGRYFPRKVTKEILDDHVYINAYAHIPTIDIIQYDASTESNFFKHWHTQNDKIENISPETLKAVGQTLMEVLYNE